MTSAAAAVAPSKVSLDGPASKSIAFPRTLDELLHIGPATLAELYRGASVPKISDVKGDLRGRMLSIPALGEPLAALPRTLASSSRFPWRGKSFFPKDADHGEGKNRVIRDRWLLFRFETFIGKSRAGAFDALQLDYDNRDNPFFIRAIKDEIRELSPGLYLGQAYLQVGLSDPRLVLYFGLSS
jgi:hypothetical protein